MGRRGEHLHAAEGGAGGGGSRRRGEQRLAHLAPRRLELLMRTLQLRLDLPEGARELLRSCALRRRALEGAQSFTFGLLELAARLGCGLICLGVRRLELGMRYLLARPAGRGGRTLRSALAHTRGSLTHRRDICLRPCCAGERLDDARLRLVQGLLSLGARALSVALGVPLGVGLGSRRLGARAHHLRARRHRRHHRLPCLSARAFRLLACRLGLGSRNLNGLVIGGGGSPRRRRRSQGRWRRLDGSGWGGWAPRHLSLQLLEVALGGGDALALDLQLGEQRSLGLLQRARARAVVLHLRRHR